MKISVSYILLMISFVYSMNNSILAQSYNFSEIKENLLANRSNNGDQEIRKNSICNIDELIMSSSVINLSQASQFYNFMINKALYEIKTEKVSDGVTVWQIYNHGFIVKTASVLIGFDLYDFYGSANLMDLAEWVDILFISHNHDDHNSPGLIDAMNILNKPVIRYVNQAHTSINVGDSTKELLIHINQHIGLHTPGSVYMYEIVTPEGYKIFHTGDNQTSETLPEIEDVDILLLNVWVNESGYTSSVQGSRNAIKKINPRVTLPGHILELGHVQSGNYVTTYQEAYEVADEDLGSEYVVLAWGERYHFEDNTNDFIPPNSVTDTKLEITNDSVKVFWNLPLLSFDNDSASFYRIQRQDVKDLLTTVRNYGFNWDSIGKYSIKIFSYDDCGNQCLNPLFIDVEVPDINYAPRIVKYTPYEKDTLNVFSGVYTVFSVEATDPNNDSLFYSWKFDDSVLYNEKESIFIYNLMAVDSGIHKLTFEVSDQELKQEHTWLINHNVKRAIVDNSDYLMYSDYGNWSDYSLASAYNGTVRFSYLTNKGDWAQYQYFPEISGYYNIHCCIPNIISGSDFAVFYVMIGNQSIDTVVINQINGRGKWELIGNYYLPESSDVKIKLVNTGRARNGVSLISDAISFTHIENQTSLNEFTYDASKNNLTCFPNPFGNYTNISFDNFDAYAYKLYIFDFQGKLVRFKNNITQSEFIIEKKDLKRGNYIVILDGPVRFCRKITVL